MGMIKMRIKVVFFGAGRFLDHVMLKKEFITSTDCLWICDNNLDMEGTSRYGLKVYGPESLKNNVYDYVVITSIYAYDIKLQLKDLGVDYKKIKTYEEYMGLCFKGKYKKYRKKMNDERKDVVASVLLITTYLSFSGGSWAAVYALMALKNNGFQVYLAAPGGDENFVCVLNERGIDVWLYRNIMFESFEEMPWLPDVDHVIINTYQMNHCLKNLNFKKKVIWWIHEAMNYYDDNIRMYGSLSYKDICCANIYAVSQFARKSFLSYYPKSEVGILEYGIPDENIKYKPIKAEHSRIIFAMVGTICPRKGQDIFIRAIAILPQNIRAQCDFWIVGDIDDELFNEKIRMQGAEISNLHFQKGMDHNALLNFYNEVDIIVSASRQDPLPIVITEGLMLGKLCIISDGIGTMNYVNSQEVMSFQSENAEDLASKIEFVVNNRVILKYISPIARYAYERNFSLNAFADKMLVAMEKTSEML